MINKRAIAILTLLMFAGIVVAVNTYNPVPQDIPTKGHLYIQVRCQHALFSYEVVLANVDKGTTESIFLNPDGKWDGELDPGRYYLILLDGNSGHPEYQDVTITAGETFNLMFLGHAVTTGPGEAAPVPTTIPVTIPPTTITVMPTTTPPTTVPTTVPTSTPTPKPTPPCHDEKKCKPGHWSFGVACILVWHPGECTITRVCDRSWSIIPI